MKSKLVTVVSDINHLGLIKLEASLKMFGYDYHIIHDPTTNWNWGGWDRMINYIRTLPPEYTHVIWTDGFDTLALGTQIECEEAFKRICGDDRNKLVYSTEKQFFPHEEPNGEVTPHYQDLFSNERLDLTDNHRWRYVNGGQFMGSRERIIEWYENAPKELNNQYWGNKYFVKQNDGRLKLDFNCELFQSVAFTGPDHNSIDEFSISNTTITSSGSSLVMSMDKKRIYNNYTKTTAPLIHGNGRAPFQWVYNILGV